ncbi:MAG: hypothetical protein M1819_006261 [Sarea resinae]|nr:MAG: hypothetical protein M1819_006261 [Sarea resinae]
MGTPLGPYDTNTVRDRVRQWQEQVGVVITAEDLPAPHEHEARPQATAKPKERVRRAADSEKPREDGKDIAAKRRSGRRKSKMEEEERKGSRSISAPRKRIVSDGHWRKQRSPPVSDTSSAIRSQTASQRTTLQDDGIRVRPMREGAERRRQRRQRKEEDTPKGSKEIPNNDGIRVYSTPSPKRDDHLKPVRDQRDTGKSSGSVSGGRSDEDRPSSRTSPLSPVKNEHHASDKASGSSPKPSRLEVQESQGRSASRRKEKTPEKSPGTPVPPNSNGKGSFESQTPKITSVKDISHGEERESSQSNPPLAPPITSNRIEAWLCDTPDPFIDAKPNSKESVAPLKAKIKERKGSFAEVTEFHDHNGSPKTRESGDKGAQDDSVRRRQRRKRNPSDSEARPALEDNQPEDPPGPEVQAPELKAPEVETPEKAVELPVILEDVPALSPTSLKRRGAKRDSSSPVRRKRKSRPKDSTEELTPPASELSIPSPLETSGSRTQSLPLNVPPRRPFPSTGAHRLSTIASVDTLNTMAASTTPASECEGSQVTARPNNSDDVSEMEARDYFDPDSMPMPQGKDRGLKRRLTTHADLISVLSLPKAGNNSIKSARSVRTTRSRLATATIGDIMHELATDETKYMRELRTLVDGVIPVLLTCVLSKSDSAVAAGLFDPNLGVATDPNFTRPIVDMGIALERLKALHRRIPLEDPNAILTWAQGAQKVYTEYLKAWRMGFQDVVVNLAPAAEGSGKSESKARSAEEESLYGGLPMNEDGDVVNGDGERVDVAFLLKRPLVRLKYLAKTLKGINYIQHSPAAETLATKYQNLVTEARRRSNEERARLEDQAANNIDPTRAREPRTLAPLTGVSIDRARRVRARDYFNMELQHSSGQRVDCRVELLLRDDPPERGSSGDLLVCEVDGTGRWLLFPPISLGRVSARNGDTQGEIILMIRGIHSRGEEWKELFVLRSDDEQAGFEWVQMIGLTPIPPEITRMQSFISKHEHPRRKSAPSSPQPAGTSTPTSTPTKSRTPSPRDVMIPIGEQANEASKQWGAETPKDGSDVSRRTVSSVSPPSSERSRLQKKPKDASISTSLSRSDTVIATPTKRPERRFEMSSTQGEFIESPTSSAGPSIHVSSAEQSSGSGLRRMKAKRQSRHLDDVSPTKSSLSSRYIEHGQQQQTQLDDYMYRERHSDIDSILASSVIGTISDGINGSDLARRGSEQREVSPESLPTSRKSAAETHSESSRPKIHRAPSSVPSMELPVIPKIRKSSNTGSTPLASETEAQSQTLVAPLSEERTPSKLQKKRPDLSGKESMPAAEEEPPPPPPPPHRSPSPVQLKGTKTPDLGSPTVQNKPRRRSSSPLKHEYEPSSASEYTSSESEVSISDGEGESSESSGEEELEDGDAPTPLLPMGALHRFAKVSPQGSMYSLPGGNATLSPSQSASQTPYKTVPQQPSKGTKTIASIFSWSEKGMWESLHPDECSILVTPGLIEAFEMSAAHSRPRTSGSDNGSGSISTPVHESEQPLVALELTPLVQLRRGTALDISIRSPPTANSKIQCGNNIMFRSRSPEECEALYAMINHARINNPTYIALQNARGPYNEGFASSMDRRNSTRSSWWHFGSGGAGAGRSSYRASSGRASSIAATESSVGSFTSAFSALRRFGNGGRLFNVAKSTISSRQGGSNNTDSIYSSSSGSSTPLPPGDPTATVANNGNAIGGLSNTKIRLYQRESASKWRDMGSARLTITRPPPGGAVPGSPGYKQHGYSGNEKRILIHGKTKGECLLDVCLGESCFERVARTGIALSAWEESMGPNGEVGMIGAKGGVGGTKARVYMIQMKSEAETAYTFSLVGKLRY